MNQQNPNYIEMFKSKHSPYKIRWLDFNQGARFESNLQPKTGMPSILHTLTKGALNKNPGSKATSGPHKLSKASHG